MAQNVISTNNIVVANGGTGVTSTVAYALQCGGTTTTAAYQTISPVATGQVLVSGGTGALPAFSATPTVTSIKFGSGSTLSTFVQQGTFTPALNFGGSATGFTYSTQIGYYTQIGNTVFVAVDILLSAKGSGTGDVTLTGLPIAAASTGTTGTTVLPVAQINFLTPPASSYIAFQTATSSTTLSMINWKLDGSGASFVTTSNSTFYNNSLIRFQGFYFTS